MTAATPEKIRVPRHEFRAALRVLRPSARRRGVRSAVVTSREGLLRIEIEEAVCEIAVDGGWLARTEVPARPLVALASQLPEMDPLEIWIHAGLFHVGPLWMKLHRAAGPPPLSDEERAHLDVRTIRRFYAMHAESVKAQKLLRGYQRRLPLQRDAELRVMRRCAKAASLLYNFGVTEQEIWDLVRRRILSLGERLP